MAESSVSQEILAELQQLGQSEQRVVLDFARRLHLTRPHGKPGTTLKRFAGAIPSTDLQLMSRAISQDCRRVDASEW